MEKKDVYLEIYQSSIQQINRVATKSGLLKCLDKSIYYEAQLIHKFSFLLKNEYFNDMDIDFLNWGAKNYYEMCDVKKSVLYNEQLQRLSMLFSLVPEEMRHKLEWDGPVIR
ncbi:hypothetical protein GNE01_02530 [Klebsiella sp. JL973]|uniref:Uncharacterized protein n=2 Tax=Klebsiella grimontii TaxID=2058152 RepID=A0A285B4K8_9ENTR|nr:MULTISPECIES: hypothetical protein [Klebsiella]AWT20421.1 hypothetical protein DMP75_19850 [Klebsiella michiganensis]QLT64615.1 hypothetical protein HV202_12815 [Klebsiella oxytoca]ARI08830.1 hypothetical protein BWI76_15360 [Klebsiella sp. M5al]EGT0067199.1 hypothetical protein [Klebsiella michiganensis]EKP27373.1 hypothetical protein KOXM_14220 [Klebsiella michiganensis]